MTALADLSAALFGDWVDPDALVAKMDPGVSDVHSMGESNRAVLIPRPTGRKRRAVRKASDNSKRFLEGTGVAATAVGGALGVREVAHQADKIGHPGLLRAVRASGRSVPAGVTRVLSNPRVRLGVVGGMLGGDAIATAEQLRHMRRAKVDKGFNEMVGGILRNSRELTALHTGESTGRHAAGIGRHRVAPSTYTGRRRAADVAGEAKPKLTGSDRAIANGTAVRNDVKNFAGTTSGKVVLGGAGVAAAGHSVGARRERRAAAADPYAIYGKRDTADVTFSGTFSKFDDEKRLAFGWANVSKVNGTPVVDRQGDYVSIEDIEEAAYTYVERSRIGGDMHKRIGGKFDRVGDRPHHVADLVESMVFDDAKCEALGLADDFPRGWWVGFRVFDDEVWDMAKDGRRTGFSIHGKGIRKSVDYDELMGVT